MLDINLRNLSKDTELINGGIEISYLALDPVILTPINCYDKIHRLDFEHTDLEMPLRHFKRNAGNLKK